MIILIKNNLIWIYALFKIYLISKNLTKIRVNNSNVFILISSWYGTFIPIYAVYMSLLLKYKYSKNITYIIQDIDLDDKKLNPFYLYIIIFKFLLNKFGDVISTSRFRDVVDMNKVPESIHRYAHIDFVHDCKSEYSHFNIKKYKNYSNKLNIINNAYESILSNVDRIDFILVPGGISLSTGLLKEACDRRNFRFASFDSGQMGEFLLSVNGVACYLDDACLCYKKVMNDI